MRCPICRGRINDSQVCTRCGANLTKLIEIENKHDLLCYQAIVARSNNQTKLASKYAAQAFKLKHSSLSEFLFISCI